MADLKISQLTSATLPLAGTEVLPIVQSSSTKKVATDDLTVKNVRSNATTGILQIAGPAAAATRTMTVPDANFTAARTDAAQSFTGDQTLGTGNLIQGTAAKGINFTANTNAPGMTSELLNWYEEGTWTPAYSASGMSGITYGTFTGGTYVRVGNVVTAWFTVYTFGTFTKGTGAVTVTGLPFTSIATTAYSTGASLSNATRWDATPPVAGRLDNSSTIIGLYSNIGNTGSGADPTAVQATNMRSAAGENCNYFQGSIVYRV